MGVFIQLLLIGHLYLIGVWLGGDQRTNTIKTHAQKRLDYINKFYLTTPHSIVNTSGRTHVLR